VNHQSILNILISSCTELAPCIVFRRRVSSPPARFRGTKLSGAGTLGLTLISWFDSTPPRVPIRIESSNSRWICEVLRWWRHHIDQSTWLTWSGNVAVDVARPTSQRVGLEFESVQKVLSVSYDFRKLLETYEIHILFILTQKTANDIPKCSEKHNLFI
jgi:hypothetical protein